MLPLHFAHANGFPADTYRRLFEALRARGFDQPAAIPQMGHQPEHPVTDGWHHLVDELCHYLEQHCPEPVVGVGHSFGAVVTLMAAHRRPNDVVILVGDVVNKGPKSAEALRLARELGCFAV